MITALRGEITRLLSTRLALWTVLTAAATGLLLTGLISITGPENATPPMPGLDTAEGVSTLLGLTGVTLFIPALIGTIAITSEYRHRTIATTFLAVPRRGRVLVAKLITFGALGVCYGVLLAAASVAGISLGAAIHGDQLGLPWGQLLGLSGRIAIAAAIYMLIGVAIGALARRQILAIGITLGYFYFLEPVLMLIPGVNAIYPLLPGGATASLTRSTILTDAVASETPFAGPVLLSATAGAIILLGYAALAATAAALAPLRRDIV